jgi:hypothetical protein
MNGALPPGRAPADPMAALLTLLRTRDGLAHDPPSLDEAGWRALAHAAVAHGVAPVVHARLEANPPGPPADAALRLLNAQRVRTRLASLRLRAHLAEALQALHARGLPAIVLKGAYLCEHVYPEPSLRPMGDADLLVPRAELGRAARVLRGLGWRGPDPSSAVARPGEHELPAFERGGASIELHWSIEDDGAPFRIDEEGLWSRAVGVRVAGAQALALAPEDLLLHLCMHAAYGHGWLQFDGGLRPLCDIAFTVRALGSDIDWDTLAARAADWGVQPCAWLALGLAQELLAAPVPPSTLARMAPPQGGPRMHGVARDLAFGRHYEALRRQLPVLGRAWLDKRWHRLSRAHRWRVHLWPPAAALARAYPSITGSASAPLRYAAHWAELAAEGVRVSLVGNVHRLAARERQRQALLHWMERPTRAEANPALRPAAGR